MRLNSLLSIISLSIVSSCAVWEKSGSNIYNTNSGNVGIGTTSPKSTLMVVDTNTNPSPTEVNAIFASTSAPTYGRAISGVASNKDGQDNFGGHFSAAGDNATGVLGITTDENKTGTGGVFHAAGKQGKGVHGLAFNASDDASNYGGWFEARGRQGIGVYAKGGEQGQAAQLDGKVRIAIDEIGQALVVKGKTASGENCSGLMIPDTLLRMYNSTTR